MIVSNVSAAAWEGDAFLLTGAGTAWSTPWALNGADFSSTNTFAIVLAAGASKKFVLSGDSNARSGYFEILSREGFSDDSVITSFFYNFLELEDGGEMSADALANKLLASDRLLDSTGVPAGIAATKFVFAAERTSSVNTGFAWAPFSVLTGFQITLTLFDQQGTQLEQRTITFLGHKAQFISEAFPGVPDDFFGLCSDRV